MSDIVDRVRTAFDLVKDAPERRPDGFMRLLELRNLIPDLLMYVERLEREQREWVKIDHLKP